LEKCNLPVQGSGCGATGDSLVVITFTEVPEANLVEIVETDGAGNGIYEDRVGNAGGDDVSEVDGEKVCGTNEGLRKSKLAGKGSI
jgi:hypothetical protein